MNNYKKKNILKLRKICYILLLLTVIFVSVMLINEIIMNNISKDSLTIYLISYALLVGTIILITKIGGKEKG